MAELRVHSVAGDRARLARQVGMQFDGARDVYEAAGYDRLITPAMYLERYERQDVAGAIVDAPADESWRLGVQVLDGRTVDEGRDDTDFALAWQALAEGGALQPDGDTATGLLHYLHRVDCQAGIGHFGVLLLGVDDGQPLNVPLKPSKSPRKLIYGSVFSEAYAKISEWEKAKTSRRHGMPAMYHLTTSTGQTASGATSGTAERVHWTRCIHVAERLGSDDIFGQPRLKGPWNLLLNLEKIMAGSGEAAWKLMDAGMIISTRDGFELPAEGSKDDLRFKSSVDEFIHGLRRTLELGGMDANILNGQITDPTGLAMINIALISARTRIPKRLLLGSEEAKVAGAQDERSWGSVIEARQQNSLGPQLVRPLINRLIWCGVLPAPSSGHFVLKWPELVEGNRVQEAEAADKAASALAAIGAEVEPADFVRVYLPGLPADKVTKRAAPAPVAAPVVVQGGDGVAQSDSSFRTQWQVYP